MIKLSYLFNLIILFNTVSISTGMTMEEINFQDNFSAQEKPPIVACFDGGGIRGIIQISFLQQLEKAIGQKISGFVDCYAGTSIGGINALGLASEIPLKTMEEIYWDASNTIFVSNTFSCDGIFKCKYRSSGLEKTLKTILGEETSLSALKPRVALNSFNTFLSQQFIIKSWDPTYQNMKLWDIGLATAAAPDYFPPHLLDGKISCLDGGVGENNPVLTGIDMAYTLNPRVSPIVISIGTGIVPTPLNYNIIKKWSLLGVGENILNIIFSATSSAAENHAKERCKEGDYFRFQVDLDPKHAGLDDYSTKNIQYLRDKGDELAQTETFNALINRLKEVLKSNL